LHFLFQGIHHLGKIVYHPVIGNPKDRRPWVLVHVNNDDDLILIEEWDSMEEAEQHIRSEEFRKIMAIMDMAVEPPEISFHTISSTMGFEFVEKTRENGNT